MRRSLVVGLALACSCATTPLSASNSVDKLAGEQVLARCYLIGPKAAQRRYNPRDPVLDETKTMGPSQVIWIHPRGSTIRTDDGLLYSCDRTL